MANPFDAIKDAAGNAVGGVASAVGGAASAVGGAVKSALSNVTPTAVKNDIFGSVSTPPTPTTPQAAQAMIDHVIGHQPGDDQILKNIQAIGATSSAIQVFDALKPPGQQGAPYDPHTSAQMATGSMTTPPDPMVIANEQLQTYFKNVPRAQELYIRNYDPLNKNILPTIVQMNAKQNQGLASKVKGWFSDIAGRPIGGTLNMLSKPSQYVETWYGTHFIYNDIADASLRQAMARETYGYTFNFADLHDSNLRAAKAEAIHIEDDLGLTGPAAAAEYERWLKQDGGNPGLAAHVTDMVTQMVADPLWLLPMSVFGDAAKVGMKAVSGTDDVSKLFRMANAPGLLGDFTLREVLNMPELTYREALLTHPSSLGPLRWLTAQTASGAADMAKASVDRYLGGAIARAGANETDAGKILNAKLETIAHFSDMIRTGNVSDRAAELFGEGAMSDQGLAALSAHTRTTIPQLVAKEGSRGTYVKDLAEGIIDGLNQQGSDLAKLVTERPNEFNYMLLDAVRGNAHQIVADGQSSLFPSWFRRTWMPIVNKQKQVLSYFSIDRPSMALDVMANNLLTFYWTAARHPNEASDFFAHAMGAELRAGDQELPREFANLATAAGLDPAAAFRMASSSTYIREAQGGADLARQSRLDKITDLADAVNKAQTAITAPVKDLAPTGFSRYVKWPLTFASRTDRGIRNATFFASLGEQMSLATHLRDGEGLMPAVKDVLTSAGLPLEDANRISNFMLDHMHNWVMTPGNSMADADGLRKAWMEGVNLVKESHPSTQASAYDYLTRFLQLKGYSDDAITHLAKDYEPVLQKLHGNVLSKIDQVPFEQVKAKIDQLSHSYHTMDQAMAHAMHTNPILRPISDYAEGLSYDRGFNVLEDALRSNMTDEMKHLDRYLNTVYPDWEGSQLVREPIVTAADASVRGRLNRLAKIADNKIAQLADPSHVFDEAAAWKDYWDFSENSMGTVHDLAHNAAAAINEEAVTPIDKWFEMQASTQLKHRQIIAAAMRKSTPEAWYKSGQDVANLYKQLANDRAALFGVDPNEPLQAIGSMSAAAPQIRMISEYLNYVRGNLGPDIAKLKTAAAAGEAASIPVKAPHDLLAELANDVARRGPEVARQVVGNAMFKTDLVRMNYNRQYGIDGILQMFAPYEVFGTRTAMNWAIRTARTPGATALLSQALLLPQQYAQQYGINISAGKIPIPLPGLTDFLSHIPYVGDQVKNANFGNVYWVDPLDAMFPMTRFLNSYTDQAKTTTPGGALADWAEHNTPLGLSPFAKIVGGVTGILPRDAWTNDLFSGGPFGVPLSRYGQIATNWLHTGDPTGMPPKEVVNYTNHGVFSWGFLGQILGIGNTTQLDKYRAEVALAGNVAEGKTSVDDAYFALKTHSGPAWIAAQKAADSAQFLQDFTGWLGLRAQGTTRGQNILLGQRALYSKAAANGDLATFFQTYPGYQVSRTVSKGLKDPAAEQQDIDTQLYYRDIQKLVKDPYQKSLDELNQRISSIRNRPFLTQTDEEQISFYNKEITSIRNQQDKIQTMIDNAYPNRNKELSLYTPPEQRALLGVTARWYAIKQAPTESYTDFQARQQAFLNSFPAHTTATDQNWSDLTSQFLTTSMSYNLKINIAAQKGDWTTVDQLVKDRTAALQSIHAAADKNVSRQDIEQYLSAHARPKTQSERNYNAAKSLYDMFAAYTGKDSPLSTAEKAAIYAYMRSQPLLASHYNASSIDLYSLPAAGKAALARRDILMKQYYALTSVDAQIDFLRQHEAELNGANQTLGLPNLDVADFRPQPPDVASLDPYIAQLDFTGQKNLVDQLYASGANPDRGTQVAAAAASPAGSALPSADIQALLNASAGRGY